jgi:hypothetical protein
MNELIKSHQVTNAIVIPTALGLNDRFATLDIQSDKKNISLKEKANSDSGWFNRGIMNVYAEILEFINKTNDQLI